MPDDPFDLTTQFNTTLSPEQEMKFQAWAANRLNDLYDYDLRGAYLANAQAAANGHLPDTFKKPNHPTFSDQSQYSRGPMMGGKWVDLGNGKFEFAASPINLNYRSPEELGAYFNKYEPGNILRLPSVNR